MNCSLCEIGKGIFRAKVYFNGFEKEENFSIVGDEAHKTAVCVFHFHRMPREDEVRRMIYVSRMLFPSRRLRFEVKPLHYHFYIEKANEYAEEAI